MSKDILNKLILDSAMAVSHNSDTANQYLNEKGLDFENFAKKGFEEIIALKSTKKTLSKSETFFKRSVLAAKIVEECYQEWTFGSVKFQKLLYLCEHASKMNFATKYTKQAAGPMDNRFIHAIQKEFERQKWFSIAKVKSGIYTKVTFTPMENLSAYKNYYQGYYSNVEDEIQSLIDTFREWKTDDVELVATIFYCWDKFNDDNISFSIELLTQAVYDFHKSKAKFSENQIARSFEWMEENGVYPSK